MSNGESKETPKGLLPPEAKVESKEAVESQRTPEQPRPAAFETPSVDQRPAATAPAPIAAVATTAPKDAKLMKVERILEENLGDVYFTMPADTRAKFKAKGEETALTLRGMIESAKGTARIVLKLIRDWLKMIPSVNKYYLEQEAKIKTDKIMLAIEESKKEKELAV